MNIALYILEALYVLVGVALVVLYRQCKDPGYVILALICIGSACFSYCFLSGGPLVIGGVAVGVLFFFGTSRGE